MSSKASRTYDDMLQDQALIDAMWHTDKALGNEVAYGDNKAILDNFLENYRWRETNLGSIINASNRVEDMDADHRKMFAYTLQEIEKLPSAFSEGGGSMWDAVIDYGGAAIADPTNLASLIAGGFTFGTAGAATFAAKEAAKQAAKASVKAKLKALVGKAGAASLVADGSIAATGGAYHNLKKQGIQKDLNLIDEIDEWGAVTQGLIEGVASPVVGIGAGAIGQGIGTAAGKLIDKSEIATQGKDFISRWLMPTAGVSEIQRRLIEKPTGEMLLLKEDADVLYKNLSEAIENNPSLGLNLTPEQGRDLINKALEGDKKSLGLLRTESPEISALVDLNRAKIKEAQDFADESALSKDIKGLFNTEKDYVRNIYDVYTQRRRSVPFDKFIKENPEILDKLKSQIRKNPNSRLWNDLSEKYINLKTKKIIPNQAGNEDAIVKEIAKTLYAPTTKLRKESAPLLKKRIRALDQEKISPLVRKIMGQNNDPALRALESINGLIESAARTNAIRNIAYDSVRNNYGYISKARNLKEAHAEAVAKLGPDIMRLVGTTTDVGHKKLKDKKTVTSLDDDVIEEGLKYTFVTKKEGEKLKMLLDETDMYQGDSLLASAGRAISGLQGFMKAGKTLYNPIGAGRNILGAAGYTLAGGNVRGIINAATNAYGKMTNKERGLLEEEFITSGLKGSNIDLNQAMKRIGDISNRENNQSFWTDTSLSNLARSGGLSLFGKGGAKTAEKMRAFYAAGDDVFKYGTFVNEKDKAKKVFNSYSKERQDEILDKFQKDFFYDPKVADPAAARKALENAYLKEEAARITANITPVYDRIPKLLELMRGVPVIGSFTAYPAERLRNRYNIMKQASEEISRGAAEGNGKLVLNGVKRLSGFGTMVGGLHVGTHLLNEYNNFSSEEDVLRKNAPEYDRNGALLVTGKDKKGNITYHNLNYIHPDSDMLDAVTPIMLKAFRGEDVSENLGEAVKDSFFGLIKPYVQPSLALQFASDMLGYVETGEDYFFKEALKTIEPGYANIIRDFSHHAGVMPTGVEETLYPSRFGVPSEKAEGVGDYLNKAGFGTVPFVKEKTFNPKLGLAFAMKKIARNVSEENRDFTEDIKTKLLNTSRSSSLQDIYDTDLSILKNYSDLLQVKHEEQRALAKIIDNLDGVMSRKEIKNFLKYQGSSARTGLSDKVINSVMRGRAYAFDKGRNDSFWRGINKSLEGQTGLLQSRRLNPLRKKMKEIESYYHNLDLLADAPELEFSQPK
jgi:hypothetical protein|tara:strand:- start:729 stop:4475 length:3747 start_codon:yes stop_codon:yes gene_type:complete